MKVEQVLFTDGINNLTAPHLIGDGSSPYLSNCKITTGELQSEKKVTAAPELTLQGCHAKYFLAKEEVVSSAEDRFYVEWGGFLYWSNKTDAGDGKLQRYDGTTITDLGGHIPPTSAPTVAENGAGLLNGEYSYTYTFLYDEVFETAPAPIAASVTVVNKQVKVSGFPVNGLDPAPTTIAIYRSGGLNPTFNKVNEIPFGDLEYIDNTSDFKISRQELNTGTNDAPPANIDMLVESKGTLFGAVGDKVHFSKEGQPEFWSDYNYIQLPTKCTGLGVIGDTIIAFTCSAMYAIQGRNIMDVTINKLPYAYGCRHKRTVQNMHGFLIWVAKTDENDILCAFNGSSVEILNKTNINITSAVTGRSIYNFYTNETYNDFEFQILNSLVVGKRYFLFMTNRTLIADMQYGNKTYYMDETVQGGFDINNEMFVIVDTSSDPLIPVMEAFRYLKSNAQRRNITYLTKELSGGSLVSEKEYRKIHVNASGAWGIAVYVDAKLLFTFDHTQGRTIHLPAGTHGKLIYFSISSVGYVKIKGIAVEYEDLRDGYATVPMTQDQVGICDKSVGGEDATHYYTAYKWYTTCSIFKK